MNSKSLLDQAAIIPQHMLSLVEPVYSSGFSLFPFPQKLIASLIGTIQCSSYYNGIDVSLRNVSYFQRM